MSILIVFIIWVFTLNLQAQKSSKEVDFSLYVSLFPPGRPEEDKSTNLLTHSEEREALIKFCKKSHGSKKQQIKRIYLSAGWHGFEKVSENDAELRKFIAQLHKEKIEIIIAQGYHGWVEDNGIEVAQRVIANVLRFNEQGKKDERFDGMILDIEPYVVGVNPNDKLKWNTDTKQIWKNYLAVLDMARNKVNAYKKSSGDNYSLGECMPLWYANELTGNRGSYKDVMERVDYTIFMAYYDDWQKIVKMSQEEIEFAHKNKKDCVIALGAYGKCELETPKDSDTFMEEGIEALNLAQEKIINHFSANSQPHEISIFHYDFYKKIHK